MTGRTTFIDGILAEVFWGLPQLFEKCPEICAQLLVSSHYHPYHYPTDVTDVSLGASALCQGTGKATGGSATTSMWLLWPQPMAPWTTCYMKKIQFLRLHGCGNNARPCEVTGTLDTTCTLQSADYWIIAKSSVIFSLASGHSEIFGILAFD